MSLVKQSAVVITLVVAITAACNDAGSDGGGAVAASGNAGTKQAGGAAGQGKGGSSAQGKGGSSMQGEGGSSMQGEGGDAGMPSSGSGGALGGTASTEGGSGGIPSAGDGPGGAGGAGAGGVDPVVIDPRPGCTNAHLIRLSLLQVVEQAGPGEQAILSVVVTNNTGQFLSGSGISFACDMPGVVETAQDSFQKFGILAGTSEPVKLRVKFRNAAEPGQSSTCTVVSQPTAQAPTDCSNANQLSIDVTVQ